MDIVQDRRTGDDRGRGDLSAGLPAGLRAGMGAGGLAGGLDDPVVRVAIRGFARVDGDPCSGPTGAGHGLAGGGAGAEGRGRADRCCGCVGEYVGNIRDKRSSVLWRVYGLCVPSNFRVEQ